MIIDVGPWAYGTTKDGRVFLQSASFTHDVRLYIDGDFSDKNQKETYAEGLCFMLNEFVFSNTALSKEAEQNVIPGVWQALLEGHNSCIWRE